MSRSLVLLALALVPAIAAQEVGLRPEWHEPLSSTVAITAPVDLSTLVRFYVRLHAAGRLPSWIEFPVEPGMSDRIRTIGGTRARVVAKWLDPLGPDASGQGPRFGGNPDFLAFFGDGWAEEGGSPWYAGSSCAGWLWVNHEEVMGAPPTTTSAPTGQRRTLARALGRAGLLAGDPDSDVRTQAEVDAFIRWEKRELGGSWMRVERDPATRQWRVDRGAPNVRYDSTSGTLLAVTGQRLTRAARDDAGQDLPAGVVPGLAADCSGGVSPWGTVLTAEENVQDWYGDLECCWTVDSRFVSGVGFDPGELVHPAVEASPASAWGRSSDPAARKDVDGYGFLCEVDPGQPPGRWYRSAAAGGDGRGHRKLGALGRARWENGSFAVDRDFALAGGEPIVLYAADDRLGGRIYKFVSRAPYERAMDAGRTRALLDEGTLYVGHFEDLDHSTGNTYASTGGRPTARSPGRGTWIRLSVDNVLQEAPNAAGLGAPGTTVGAALRDVRWNGIGGFADDDAVRRALFTASNKLGIAELNRPEDVEYAPRDPSGRPRLYVAFTRHLRRVACDQRGVLYPPDIQPERAPKRQDGFGSIFAIEEEDAAHPARSATFAWFQVWQGTVPEGSGDPGLFAAANPDNLLIDRHGGVWFTTDGNPGSSGLRGSDALYYLDLDPDRRPDLGLAYRIAALPSDAEATGPCLTPDHATLFLDVQHPGEDSERFPSTWPQDR